MPPIPHSATGGSSRKPASIWEKMDFRWTNCLSRGNGTEKMALIDPKDRLHIKNWSPDSGQATSPSLWVISDTELPLSVRADSASDLIAIHTGLYF